MKILAIRIVNFIVNPKLYLFFQYSVTTEGIPAKRNQFILLATNIIFFKLNYKTKKSIALLVNIIFTMDLIIDSRQIAPAHLIKEPSIILSNKLIARNLENIEASLTTSQADQLKVTILQLLKADIKATEAVTLQDYLTQSRISIGLFPIIELLSFKLDTNKINGKFKEVCAEIIRIVSDLSTIRKDKNEHGNNITNFITIAETKKILSERAKYFYSFQTESKLEYYIKRLTKITLALYKNGNDFEF